MRLKTLFIVLTCLLVTMGCEKNYYYYGDDSSEVDDDNDDETTKNDSNDDSDDDSGYTQGVVLTVAEAQEVTDGTDILVKGYVIGSCTKSMKNAVFCAPFAGTTAIILADDPVDANDLPSYSDPCLFPVCISTYDYIRDELNLEGNPQLWNTRITVSGIKNKYLGRAGLSETWDWKQ